MRIDSIQLFRVETLSLLTETALFHIISLVIDFNEIRGDINELIYQSRILMIHTE
jgi:hypothetical protein